MQALSGPFAGQPAPFLTVGYAGLSVDDLVRALQSAGVDVLVDIRWTAISRRPGFSKSVLGAALQSRGVGYLHIRVLGSPKELRTNLQATADFEAFSRDYNAWLEQQTEAIDALLELMQSQRVCLMCLEEDPSRCHRSILAEALGRRLGETARWTDLRTMPGVF